VSRTRKTPHALLVPSTRQHPQCYWLPLLRARVRWIKIAGRAGGSPIQILARARHFAGLCSGVCALHWDAEAFGREIRFSAGCRADFVKRSDAGFNRSLHRCTMALSRFAERLEAFLNDSRVQASWRVGGDANRLLMLLYHPCRVRADRGACAGGDSARVRGRAAVAGGVPWYDACCHRSSAVHCSRGWRGRRD